MRTRFEIDAEQSLIAAQARIVRRATTAIASRARVERASTLTLNEVAVLGRLTRNGSMTPGELSAQLGAKPQSLTRTFTALERNGHVLRTPDPGDGRQSILTITSTGRTAITEEMRPRDRWLTQAMAQVLTPAERAILVEAAPLLERLAAIAPDQGPHREAA
jgi:DNA-binding MarR family transcriptional regulator